MKRLRHIVVGLAFALIGAAGGTGAYAQAVITLDPAKALTQYQLDVWKTEQGLPQLSINSVLRTPDGYLWLGTQEGLVRFDGIRFHIFDKKSGFLTNSHVSKMVYSSDGSLWVGTRGGGLARYRDGAFTSYTAKNGLTSEKISSLLEDTDGTLWVGTYNHGLNRLDHHRVDDYSENLFTPLTTGEGLPRNGISSLLQTLDGALWIGTRGAGVVRYDDGDITAFGTDAGLPSDFVSTVYQARDGALWVGTFSEGLSRLALGHDGLPTGEVTTYSTDDGLTKNGVNAVYEDAAGTIWIGLDRGGLCRLHAGDFSCLTTDSGLSHDKVVALFGDDEGSLWIGTDGGGLNRLRDGKFITYTTHEGLGLNNIYTITQAADGAMWMGTEDGGASRFKDGVFTTYTTEDGLGGNDVLSVGASRDGSVWIGTTGGGLTRFKDGVFTTYTTEDGLPDDTIWGLFSDSNDNLWIATVVGLVQFKDGVFTTFTTEHGLASDEITSIEEDPSGDLWVGTYNHGIHRFDYREGRVLQHITVERSTNFVLAIYVDEEEDVVWFSTQEAGLHRIEDGELTTFDINDGFLNDTFYQILDDGWGNLWLSSNLGIFVISKQDLNAYIEGRLDKLTPERYSLADGLKSQEFMGGTQPAGWRSTDGHLWFPTVGGGVASIDPTAIRLDEHPPKVYIEQALVNDEAIPLAGQATVPPGRNRFEFRYAGLSLLAPRQVRYRYKLDGFDEGWKDAGAMREASYTNLEPGVYTFKVMARNNDGFWSEEAASVSFYLQPYFYQTAWFYVFGLLSLVLTAFFFYRLRVRHLKRRERELVQLVEVRTTDLRQEKERTEEALRETDKAWREAQQQKEIAEKAKAVIEEQAEKLQEMDRIKTRFFNNISHEFRTPLTLNIGPLENAMLGVYGPVSAEMKQQLDVMLRNSRLLLRLINQLLDVAKLESGKMGLRVRHGNLVELLEGIVLSFTAFAEKKELTVDFSTNNKDLTLNFDPGHLEKVFFNLLSNAVKFTPENGCISVAVFDEEDGANGVEGAAVIIRFKDTGPGIPAEALPYVFDRFQQVDGTISRVQEGTGIGLSLVKELVELHGGTILVESEVGVGTEFIVTLPKDTRHLDEHAAEFEEFEEIEAEDQESAELMASISETPMVEMAVFDSDEAADDEGAAPALPPGAATVLVVDDNPEIRAYVAGCLKHSYHVVKAVDGQDALAKVRDSQPDLIISDVMMPNMDGYQLCRTIKSDEHLSHIPVILLTSRASLDEKIKGLEAGSDDYLTKPFSARELLVRARNLLHLGLQKKELKALNGALKQANAELREASQMKSQLLRIAAHDLKNPLNGIREFAKILKDEVPTGRTNRELLDLIHTSSDQMLSMVSKLLDSEALESGELILNKETVSISTIAEEVVRRNRPQAERKDEALILHLDEADPCLVDGSWEWLRDAMDNLVSNAVKYSPLGKTIWVSVKRRGPVVRFSVRDEGPGLTGDDKRRLFGKFQRLSALPTDNESSTGLGLSIVKQIVEMHEGKVWAESAEGEGSTFIMELACAEEASPDEVSPPPSRESRDGIPPSHGHRTDSGLPAESD